MQAPGDLLLDVCQQAQREVLLVAPFVKLNTLQRILDVIADDVSVQCVTRWRPDEIAAGVSDIEIWPVIRERTNSSLWLRADLHAKYYRGDQRILVGSANLTNAALSWSQHPNLEILVDSPMLSSFETMLFGGSVKVDDDLYMHTKQSVDLFFRSELLQLGAIDILDELAADELIAASPDTWTPTLRHPENLYIAYVGNEDQLSSASRLAAMRDLAAFDVPRGLSREQFEAYIAQQLFQKPIIWKVDQFIEKPQRFGAVRDFMQDLSLTSLSSADANHSWQTLMRWLKYFTPDRYSVTVFRNSEVIHKSLDSSR